MTRQTRKAKQPYKTKQQQIEEIIMERDIYKDFINDYKALVEDWRSRCEALEKELNDLKQAIAKLGYTEMIKRLHAVSNVEVDK